MYETSLIALIGIFGGNYAPKGWAFCDGQYLSIQQNPALFALLGTTYGGNGTTNFALPDLRGRRPIHWGQSTLGSNYYLGQKGGNENVTLTVNNLPAHTHSITNNMVVSPSAANTAATTNTPSATVAPAILPKMGTGPAAVAIRGYDVPTAGVSLAPGTISGTINAANAGGNQPFSTINPYLGVSYCIALQGIFPSRN